MRENRQNKLTHPQRNFMSGRLCNLGGKGLLTVDQIAEVRILYRKGERIRSTVKQCGLSRNTARISYEATGQKKTQEGEWKQINQEEHDERFRTGSQAQKGKKSLKTYMERSRKRDVYCAAARTSVPFLTKNTSIPFKLHMVYSKNRQIFWQKLKAISLKWHLFDSSEKWFLSKYTGIPSWLYRYFG